MHVLLSVVAVLLLGSAAYASDASTALRFEAQMIGANEVPPVTTPASGIARYRVSRDGRGPILHYAIRLRNIVGFAVGHIHCGDVGVKGPVLVHSHGLNAAGADVVDAVAGRGRWTDASVSSAPTVVTRPVACVCQGTPVSVNSLSDVVAILRRGCGYAEYHRVADAATPTVFPGVIRGQIMPVLTDAIDDDEEEED